MRKLIYDSIESMQESLLLKEISKIAKNEIQRKEMEEHFKGRKIIDIKRIKGSGLIASLFAANESAASQETTRTLVRIRGLVNGWFDLPVRIANLIRSSENQWFS